MGEVMEGSRRPPLFICTLVLALLLIVPGVSQVQQLEPVAILPDTSEAERALLILKKEADHQTVTAADWDKLFSSVPYKWLKDREKSVGQPFTDASFQAFLASAQAVVQEPDWAQALDRIKRADL